MALAPARIQRLLLAGRLDLRAMVVAAEVVGPPLALRDPLAGR
jgi:hypothetical protein